MLFRTEFRGVKVVWLGFSPVFEFSSELDEGQTATDCGSGAQKQLFPRECALSSPTNQSQTSGSFHNTYKEMVLKDIKLIVYDIYIFLIQAAVFCIVHCELLRIKCSAK